MTRRPVIRTWRDARRYFIRTLAGYLIVAVCALGAFAGGMAGAEWVMHSLAPQPVQVTLLPSPPAPSRSGGSNGH